VLSQHRSVQFESVNNSIISHVRTTYVSTQRTLTYVGTWLVVYERSSAASDGPFTLVITTLKLLYGTGNVDLSQKRRWSINFTIDSRSNVGVSNNDKIDLDYC
jgi:hypothetical protein